MSQIPYNTVYFSGRTPGAGGAVTDVDNPQFHPEDALSAPWCVDPTSSWLDYRCYVRVLLDPGSVLHKVLPQENPAWDTLGSVDMASQDFMASTNAVDLNSNSRAVDVIQRMASSTYRFALLGHGLRAGYRVPIPNLVSVAGLKFVPTFPQTQQSQVAGNLLGGIPLCGPEGERPTPLCASERGLSRPPSPCHSRHR